MAELALVPTDPWRERAACREMPTDLFFPWPTDLGAVATAIATCAGCEVRDSCLDAYLTEKEGIFGGFTAEQRRAIRLGRRVPPALVSRDCGWCESPFRSIGGVRFCCEDCRDAAGRHQDLEASRRHEQRKAELARPHQCAACLRRFAEVSKYARHLCPGEPVDRRLKVVAS